MEKEKVEKVQEFKRGNLKVERFSSGVVRLSVGGSSEEMWLNVDSLREVADRVEEDLEADN